eukprot:s1665_g24.t1
MATNSVTYWLELDGNNIGDAGALALAAGLRQNRGLRRLWLSRGSMGDEGRQALADAEETKKERGFDVTVEAKQLQVDGGKWKDFVHPQNPHTGFDVTVEAKQLQVDGDVQLALWSLGCLDYQLTGNSFGMASSQNQDAMQMVLLMSVICGASGFTLEMPDLPDLIGTVGKVFHGNFTLKMMEEPDVFLPKVSQIETMTREESMERFHWYFCVYVLIFLGVTLLGSE